ncbi:hypothetical protein OF83DRAFT_1171352 [Amylostereum chailletii]|nr:hypothetical protein OF83DRAFT_1171352 [Amylostereum chailletii]
MATTSARQPFTGPKRRLVLAFDLGTTFSGVSYALLDPGKVPEIKSITRFPGQEAGDSKIPTVIYYDAAGKVLAVGAEEPAMGVEDEEDEDWEETAEPLKVEWFKLLLRPSPTTTTTTDDIPRPTLPASKDIVAVYADFYAYLYERARAFITETHASGDLMWKSLENDIDVVLSHPNGWEGPQQATMRKAAVKAGLVPDTRDGHDRIKFVSEGEASFHFCVTSGLLADVIQTGSNIMIVDAGGGTVDLSSYTFANATPIEIEEIATPAGIFLGSVMVRHRAHQYLTNKLVGSKFGTPEYVNSITEEFDRSTKKRFKGTGDSWVKFSSMATDRDLKFGIRNGQIKLSEEEVLALFAPAVTGIVRAIEAQRASAGASAISTYLLVGGFAASEHLFAALQDHLAKQGLRIFRPDSHTSKAVAEGAVSYHIDHFVSTRVAKMTYGSKCTHVFKPGRPDHQKRASKAFFSADGLQMIHGGFTTILAKGTQIAETTEFERAFHVISRFGVQDIECEVTCYRGDVASPEWTDDEPDLFSTLCTITADVSHVPKKVHKGPRGDYIRQDYRVVLSFGMTELEAHLAWTDKGLKQTGPALVVYDDDFAVNVPQ